MTVEQRCRYLHEVREFIVANFPVAAKMPVADNDELLTKGIVDSLGLLLVIDFLETKYGISVHETEVVLANFGTVDSISAYIAAKLPS